MRTMRLAVRAYGLAAFLMLCPGVNAAGQERSLTTYSKLCELIRQDSLTPNQITWLVDLSKNRRSKHWEEATIKLGMVLMAHPELADILVPSLIEIYFVRGEKERWVVPELLGGNDITVSFPKQDGIITNVAAAHQAFHSLANPETLIKTTSSESVLPETLREHSGIIDFLCTVPYHGGAYPQLARFKGEKAHECLVKLFEQDEHETQEIHGVKNQGVVGILRLIGVFRGGVDPSTAILQQQRKVEHDQNLANGLLRFGDTRGLSILLKHLRSIGHGGASCMMQTIAATRSKALFMFCSKHLTSPQSRRLLFTYVYHYGDGWSAGPFLTDIRRRNFEESGPKDENPRNDYDMLEILARSLGDLKGQMKFEHGELTKSSKPLHIDGFQFTIQLLIKALDDPRQETAAEALALLNLLADLRIQRDHIEYPHWRADFSPTEVASWRRRRMVGFITEGASRVAFDDFVRQDAESWRAWFERHRTHLSTPDPKLVEDNREPIEPITLDSVAVDRSIAEAGGID